MSVIKLTLWLAVALYLAKKCEPIIDTTCSIIWRHMIVPCAKSITPKPTSRIRLAAQWMWWQLTKVER